MSSTLTLFTGKAHDAVGTVMPGVCEWVEQTFQDLTDVRETDDHGVIVWANMPTAGILGAHKKDWCVTFLANVLQKFKRNSIAVLVHTNRAAQASPGSGFFFKALECSSTHVVKTGVQFLHTWSIQEEQASTFADSGNPDKEGCRQEHKG